MSKRALHIALLTHSLNPRGGVVHALELADALVGLGHRVTVIAAGRTGQTLFRASRASVSVAPLQQVPASLAGSVRARMQAVAAHLRTLDLDAFDVLHTQDSITANALADLQDEGRIAGFVRTVHHLDTFDESLLADWQARGVHRAALLLCVSGMWQGVLAREWGRYAYQVSNGVNLGRYSPAQHDADRDQDDRRLACLGIHPEFGYWLAVGGVEARKNTTRLLEAFARIAGVAPSAQLVIVGGASLLDHGPTQVEFNAARQAHGLALGQPQAHRLVLAGPVADEVLLSLYRRAIALVMPSIKEGFGLAAIEAMACGTPAIVSRIAPFTEHLHREDALWVDPFDIDDIAQALRGSLDAHQRALLVRRSAQVAARFDWRASAIRHVDLYRAHLDRSAPKPSNVHQETHSHA